MVSAQQIFHKRSTQRFRDNYKSISIITRKLEKQMFTYYKIFTYDGNNFSFILTKHYFIYREQIMKGKKQIQTYIKDKSWST